MIELLEEIFDRLLTVRDPSLNDLRIKLVQAIKALRAADSVGGGDDPE